MVKTQFDEEAYKSIAKGAETVKEFVSATLGPRGNNIIIGREWGVPRVIHDGVTVAKAIDPEDEFEKVGADLIKDAATRTNDAAGDGTTTAIILAHAIYVESMKNVIAGSNAMMIRRGIEVATQMITDSLYKMAVKVESTEQKNHVATISAQDETIGKLIVQALEKVGEDGVVTVERGNTADIEIEYKEGMQFDRGWISPHFINNPATGEATVEKPVILITNKTVGNMQELLPLLQLIIDTSKITQLVVIAKNVIGEALASLALNTIKGTIQSIAIPAPGNGDQQDALLEDLAKVTGATFVNENLGKNLNELTMDDLGKADRVTSSQERTIIVGGAGDKKQLEEHVKFLREQRDRTDISEYRMEQYKERLAKLVSGVAVINVGANSEAEADEKRERIIDAVSATRSAIEEGIVPGGETALLKAALVLADIDTKGDREIQTGIDIVARAVRYPYLKLLENSGISEAEAEKKITAAEKDGTQNVGIDVITGTAEDLIQAGVIDPVKVTRSALQNAASTATMLMTSKGIIVPIREEKSNGPQFPTQ